MGTVMTTKRFRDDSSGAGSTESLHQLIERVTDVTVDAQAELYVPINIGYDKFELRTISVVQTELPTTYVLSAYDKQTGGALLYQSLEESATYDIINVPIFDKDNKQTLHLYLRNTGSIATKIHLIVRATNFA